MWRVAELEKLLLCGTKCPNKMLVPVQKRYGGTNSVIKVFFWLPADHPFKTWNEKYDALFRYIVGYPIPEDHLDGRFIHQGC